MESLLIFPFVMYASASSRAFAIAKGKMSVKDSFQQVVKLCFPNLY